MEIAETLNALENLRQKIESLKYRGIESPTTVSIGFIVIDPDCFLTDREAEQRANWAKNHAKEHGRNRIAWCKGPLFRKEDLSLTEQAKSKIPR
jgi:GGDEF domain-containing protein